MLEKPYYLGLDMGTNSVGWAVTDQQYNLLKAKGKDLWGIREFAEADTSVERRTHRISRRRRQREQARIGLLNDYFHDAIIAIDPSFFQRLENSKYHLEDKDQNVRYKYNIFNDPDYTDADYYTQYPTIYHLRKELLENPKPHDVRLVYLALLNMFKHRGHFLNSGISDGNNERSLKDAYINFAISVSELTEDYFNQDVDYSTIEGILSSRDLNRTKKAEELSTVLGIDFKNKKYKEYLRAICGLKINAYTLFSDQLPDDTTKIDLCVSDASFDEKSEELVSLIGEDLFQIILNIKEIYDIGSLAGILKGYTYLSQARVAAYDKHKHDLKLLKSSIKKYCTKEEYNNFFNSDADGSYASYIGSFNSGNKERRVGSKRTSEDLYKEIKKLLKGANKSDPAINEIFTSIETESFLPKQLTASNGIIPNQVHSKEMARILTNDTSMKVRKQIAWSEDIKTAVWTEIVTEKIRKQAENLEHWNQGESELLYEYISQMEFGDATNREGHAAKVYFNALFGMDFTRTAENSINAALNYGYSLLLSTCTREITINGYITQLGLFHDNMFNPFNLASDLMEPFRPLVDNLIKQMAPEKFEHDEKMEVVKLLQKEIILAGRKEYLSNAMKLYCRSVFDALNDGDISLIKFYKNEL